MKKAFLATIACCLVTSYCAPKQPAEPVENARIVSNISLRSGPSLSAPAVIEVRAGAIVEVISREGQCRYLSPELSGSWVKIKYKNRTGYALGPTLAPTQVIQHGRLRKVKLYSEPSTISREIGTIGPGEKFKYIGEAGKREIISGKTGHWIKVQFAKKQGYVFEPTFEKLQDRGVESYPGFIEAIEFGKNEHNRDYYYFKEKSKTAFDLLIHRYDLYFRECQSGAHHELPSSIYAQRWNIIAVHKKTRHEFHLKVVRNCGDQPLTVYIRTDPINKLVRTHFPSHGRFSRGEYFAAPKKPVISGHNCATQCAKCN